MDDLKSMDDVVSAYRRTLQVKFKDPVPKLKIPTSDEGDLRARLTAAYMLAVESRDVVFKNDPDTEKNIQMVANWMCESPKRGLLLYGTTGNGKTTMLNAIRAILDNYTYTEAVRIWSAAHQATEEDEYWMQTYMTSPILIIDDLGAEPEICKVYGENRYPLESVIVRRYRSLLTTIIASNLTLDQIEHRYGTRMFDRLMEMYDRIVYRGPSFRRQAK